MSASATKLLQSLELAVGKQGKHSLWKTTSRLQPTRMNGRYVTRWTLDVTYNLDLECKSAELLGKLIHSEHSAILCRLLAHNCSRMYRIINV